ncbi:MAG: RIP metalloprotease RseP [Alphaproteobacteria bacterium]|nr:RIP metalloprotease RseP [Alphaproteobacteria bacterium]
MDILQTIYSDSGLNYILPFLFVLTIVVFFHELGHFAVARWCGVKIETFSIGFGRAIFRKYDKHGTEWKIGWLPLGGYVKFLGDENAASAPSSEKLAGMDATTRQDTLHYKPVWQRSAVAMAGPFANFLLAIVIFAGLFGIVGQQIITPVIDQVVADSAAATAQLKQGDVIQSIDGTAIDNFNEVRRLVTINADTPLLFGISRGGVLLDVVVVPKRVLETDRFGNEYHVGRLGITARTNGENIATTRHNPIAAVGLGVKETYFIIEQTLSVLGRIISGREGAESLGGPLRIAQISGQTASVGWVALINLTATLSVSIGLVNLFPIPMLDGGHLVFYGYEAVRGKPLSMRAQEIAMRFGLGFVLLLFVFVTWNDIIRLVN